MKDISAGLGMALLLLSCAPDSLVFSLVMRFSVKSPVTPVFLRSLAVSSIGLLDAIAFGWPPFKAFSLVSLGIAVLTGIVYYGLERWRLQIGHKGSLRIAGNLPRADRRGLLLLGLLVWTALAEEILYRWYVLQIPLAYGLFPPVACILLTGIAFALSHHHFGTSTMISRGIFGSLLALPVLYSGDLVFPVVAHVTYNTLVHFWPVKFFQIQKEV